MSPVQPVRRDPVRGAATALGACASLKHTMPANWPDGDIMRRSSSFILRVSAALSWPGQHHFREELRRLERLVAQPLELGAVQAQEALDGVERALGAGDASRA